MYRSNSQLYIHYIWGTWDRLNLIDEDMEPVLYKYLRNKSVEHKCWVEQIGGTSNHIHILTRLTTSISVSHYAQSLKGSSSHFISQIHRQNEFFKWQGGYGAFSVSPFFVQKISEYILNQKNHHQKNLPIKNGRSSLYLSCKPHLMRFPSISPRVQPLGKLNGFLFNLHRRGRCFKQKGYDFL